jgi:hypothetical protein
VNLAVWSPRSASSEALARLLTRFGAPGGRVVRVSEDAAPRGDSDLDLYDIGDHPAHAFAFRAARERPGVVLLRQGTFPRLLAGELARPGSRKDVLREMERAHGEEGAFVARLVARGLGGDALPAFFPLIDPLLETSLGVVALTGETGRRAARRLGEDRTLRLPLHLLASGPSSREEARRHLSIPDSALVLAAPDPDSSRLSSLIRVASRLRDEFPDLRLLVGALQADVPDATLVPDLAEMAAAADVIVALDPLTPYGIPAGLSEALASRRPLVVNAGSGALTDFPEGSLARVPPGRSEEEELEAVLRHLFRRPDLREALGRLAHEEARKVADPEELGRSLAGFLDRLLSRKETILGALRDDRQREAALLRLLSEEVEEAGRSLGLRDLDLGLPPLFEKLVRVTS